MPLRRHPVARSSDAGALAGFPIERDLVQRLRDSYDLVRQRDLQLAEIFYERLFTAAPAVRPLFTLPSEQQAAKLMAALDAIVRNLTAPADNAALLNDLGKRHAAYGARPEHYDLVIDLLVESMTTLLGDEIDATVFDEWRMALRLVSDQMIAAAQRAPPASP